MKFVVLSIIMFLLPVNAYPQNKFSSAVQNQKESDSANVKKQIEKTKNIIKGYNDKLKASGISSNLGLPIDENNIKSVNETEDSHQDQAETLKAFAKIDDLMYDDPDSLKKVDKIKKSESFSLVEKTEKKYTYKNKTGRWFLVEKENGVTGWVHSSVLSAKKPDSSKELTDKSEIDFDIPASGRRTSNFGERVDPVTKKKSAFHSGIDIAAPQGTPVKSAESGKVKFAGYKQNGYGNLIIVEHPQGYETYYGHLSKISIEKGDNVKKGDLIGAVGSTGKSTGPHLHFEVRKDDKPINPDSVLK